MTPKHTYKIEHEGQTYTRTTARTYTHIVIGTRPDTWTRPGETEAISWAGRLDLAIKKANSKECSGHLNVRIIEIPEERADQAPTQDDEPDEAQASAEKQALDNLVCGLKGEKTWWEKKIDAYAEDVRAGKYGKVTEKGDQDDGWMDGVQTPHWTTEDGRTIKATESGVFQEYPSGGWGLIRPQEA